MACLLGFFFLTLKVYYMYWNIEKNISFGMYFSFQAKYVITFPLNLHVYHKNGHRIKKIYSTSNVCILSNTFLSPPPPHQFRFLLF